MEIDKSIRILIVEDDEINRKLLASILKSIGFKEVVEAENGKFAWEKMQKETFDLVLTDWMMPELDGLQLLQKIRQSSDGLENTPVLMVTALGKQDDIAKASKWNVDGYIVKPYTVTTILAKIEEVMK